MRINSIISRKEFAGIIGCSRQVVDRLVSSGIIREGDSWQEWLASYCIHVREQAAVRTAAGGLELAAERARLAAEQADRIALQNRAARREYAPVSVITEAMASVGHQIAGILEALGAKLTRNIAMSTEQLALIEHDLAEARDLAANVEPDWGQIDGSDAD